MKKVWSTVNSVGAWRSGGDAVALAAAFTPNANIDVVSPPEIVAPQVIGNGNHKRAVARANARAH